MSAGGNVFELREGLEIQSKKEDFTKIKIILLEPFKS